MRASAIPACAVRGNSVEVRIREGADVQTALTKLRELSQPLGGILGGTGQRTVDITDEPAASSASR